MLSRVAAKAAWRSAAAIPTRALHSFAVESTPNENSRKFVLKDGAILDSQYGTGIVRSDTARVLQAQHALTRCRFHPPWRSTIRMRRVPSARPWLPGCSRSPT